MAFIDKTIIQYFGRRAIITQHSQWCVFLFPLLYKKSINANENLLNTALNPGMKSDISYESLAVDSLNRI